MRKEKKEKVNTNVGLMGFYKNIQKIAIVSSSGDFTPPCGICRQVMEEFMADGTVVLSNGKEIKEYTVRELLPAGFSAEDMKG